MPVVVGLDIHGQFGKSLIYQGNYVRAYFIPANPRSTSQQATRAIFSAEKEGLAHICPAVRTLIAAEVTPRDTWSSDFFHVYVGPNFAAWNAGATAWEALTSDGRDSWQTNAEALGSPAQIIVPDASIVIYSGQAWFQACRTTETYGIAGLPSTTPDSDNADEWSAAIGCYRAPPIPPCVVYILGTQSGDFITTQTNIAIEVQTEWSYIETLAGATLQTIAGECIRTN